MWFFLSAFQMYAKNLVFNIKQNHKMPKQPKWSNVKVGIFKDAITAMFD